MKFHVAVDGESCVLELQRANGQVHYSLTGVVAATGSASVDEISHGVFSILLGTRSLTVYVTGQEDSLEVWSAGRRLAITLADARDRVIETSASAQAGPVEIRAHMPGKVVKLLVKSGAQVQAGDGLVVVEAMKMQNEMKSPKDGQVTKIYVAENATVAAAERLMIVE